MKSKERESLKIGWDLSQKKPNVIVRLLEKRERSI